MALNPYTLYHLYEKGILDYVPMDLAGATPVAPLMPMSNPYLDMAAQGGLYKNYGMSNDTFTSGISPSVQGVNPVPSNVQIGIGSNAGGMNTFNGVGIGSQTQSGAAASFGFNNQIGAYTNAGGMNTYNGVGIGAGVQSNPFGAFVNAGSSITNGYNRAVSILDRTPKIILGILAGAIGIIGLKSAFKGGRIFGKKSAKTVEHTSFISKLNPKNWSWFSKKVN